MGVVPTVLCVLMALLQPAIFDASTKKVSLGERLGIRSCMKDMIDMVFLVDGSASMGPVDFHNILLTVNLITTYFNIAGGNLKVAMATFHTETRVHFYLDTFDSSTDLADAIMAVPYDGGSRTMIGNAIDTAVYQIFNEDHGHRPDAFKLLVLFTDGQSQDSNLTKSGADEARAANISSIVIGIGAGVDRDELVYIAGMEEAVVVAPTFYALEMIVSVALLKICPVCGEVEGWTKLGDTCYWVHRADRLLSWNQARRRCSSVKASLVKIHGSEEEEFILSQMASDYKEAYIGLTKKASYSSGIFEGLFRWPDKTPVVYSNWGAGEPNGGSMQGCVFWSGERGWSDVFCGEKITSQFVCTKDALTKINLIQGLRPDLPKVSLNTTSHRIGHLLTPCMNRELISKLKRCDRKVDCKDKSDKQLCGSRDGVCEETMFTCENRACVPFTYFCDGVDDCGDNSDEENCDMAPCSNTEWRCGSGQCIEMSRRCDLLPDCFDNSDELDCDTCGGFECFDGKCIPSSWLGDQWVDCDGFKLEDEIGQNQSSTGLPQTQEDYCIRQPDKFGKPMIRKKEDFNCSTVSCPALFFKCPYSYCIPIELVCNGFNDCPEGRDEISCESFECPGYYRCEGADNCIHPDQFCDGTRHCPGGDDERYCKEQCPPSCLCHGRVITCDKSFNLDHFIPSDVRKLDLSGVAIKPGSPNLTNLYYLAEIILIGCNISDIENLFPRLPNLRKLILKRNNIQILSNSSLLSFPRLQFLDLSENPLLTGEGAAPFKRSQALQKLDLHNTLFGEFSSWSLDGLSNLRELNLSNSGVNFLSDDVFKELKSLEILDLRRNNIEDFSKTIFNGLHSLEELFTESYKLCCDTIRPKTVGIHKCSSRQDQISSCTDLLGKDILRVMLWIIGTLAVFGNIAVLGFRCKYDHASLKRSYGIFVTNLCISDCVMGVYMFIIGIMDLWFKGIYLWNDYNWRHSSLCKFAGFLSTVSSEASCIFITLITLDRFLAIKFPFRQIKLTKFSATGSVIITWSIAVALAGIPLSPPLEFWDIYSQNGLCLALPLSNTRTPGWQYTSSLFVGFNFMLFLLIGLGQTCIYRAVKSSSKIRIGSSSDATVARNLFLVVFTDFLCWFPVGVMGILSLQGYDIDAEVYAWTAVLVLPVNSALNPILYTLPSVLQARRAMMDQKYNNDTDISTKATDRERRSITPARIYIGVPTGHMTTLAKILPDSGVSFDIKNDIISRVVAFILDRNRTNRRFEPTTTENVFVEMHSEGVTAICLVLESRPDRDDVTGDVLLLVQSLKCCTEKKEESRVKMDLQLCD